MSVTARQLQMLARDHLERGSYTEAIQETEEAIRLHPDFPDLHNQLGLALSLSGERERAVGEFQRALHLNPRYVEARLNLAIVLNDLGRYDEALREFHFDRPQDPDHENLSPDVRAHLAESHVVLGDTYRNLGLMVDASQEYRKALRHAPRFLDIKNKLGSIYAAMGLYQDAETVLAEALAQNPRYVDARVTLGVVLWKSGRSARAREEWERCLRENGQETRAKAYLEMLEREPGAAEGSQER
jgi:tetratricopeptide (TPR) repeat protein